MRAVLSVYLFAIMAMPSLAAELDGHYRANLDEQPTELILRSQGEQVEGEYLEGRHLRLTVSGRFDGQAACMPASSAPRMSSNTSSPTCSTASGVTPAASAAARGTALMPPAPPPDARASGRRPGHPTAGSAAPARAGP